jgi:hypothetical protein
MLTPPSRVRVAHRAQVRRIRRIRRAAVRQAAANTRSAVAAKWGRPHPANRLHPSITEVCPWFSWFDRYLCSAEHVSARPASSECQPVKRCSNQGKTVIGPPLLSWGGPSSRKRCALRSNKCAGATPSATPTPAAESAVRSDTIQATANATERQRLCCFQICGSALSTVTVCFRTTPASKTLGIDPVPALQK